MQMDKRYSMNVDVTELVETLADLEGVDMDTAYKELISTVRLITKAEDKGDKRAVNKFISGFVRDREYRHLRRKKNKRETR